MRTVRRLYFYVAAFVGLEVVVWGVIQLARTVLDQGGIGGSATRLAAALSLTLVGLPVFWIHWGVAQRDARRDPEERGTLIRALFLYGALLATAIPVAQNGLAVLDRLVLSLFGLPPQQALVGGGQSWSDNLVAILINGAAVFYLMRVLTADWASDQAGERFIDVRRLYRYIWMLYGLLLVVSGVQQVIRFLLFWPGGLGGNTGFRLANGIALLAVGVPLWVAWGEQIRVSLREPAERESLLRLGILYLLALAGAVTVLVSGGLVLATLLRQVFGEGLSAAEFFSKISNPVSIAVPLAGIWAYYGHRLSVEVEAMTESLRRAGLRRLYNYILAALGLTATLIGLQQLIAFLIRVGLGSPVWGSGLRIQLSNALALLAVGLPLWALTWRPMDAEAAQEGDAGDHARRSVVRKTYLYLALFSAVIGTMTSAGRVIFLVVNQVLGNRAPDFSFGALNGLQTFLLFALFLGYHWQALRRDAHLAGRSLAERRSGYPVLLLDPGEGSFAHEVLEAIHRQAPQLPVAVQPILEGIPGEEMAAARAVVLPSRLATHPPEALRLWLQGFAGQRIIIPETDGEWFWMGGPFLSRHTLANQAAVALRQLAEGQPVRIAPPSSVWMVIGSVLGALFALELLFVLVSIAVSSLGGR